MPKAYDYPQVAAHPIYRQISFPFAKRQCRKGLNREELQAIWKMIIITSEDLYIKKVQSRVVVIILPAYIAKGAKKKTNDIHLLA